MVDQLNGTLFPGRAGRLPACAAPEGAGRALGALRATTTPPRRSARRPAPSFMSGQLPSRTAVYDNAAEFASSIPTFAHHLRAAGYHTCLSGKMHFVGPDQLHGFEERLTTDIYPADFGWTPDYRKPGERIDWWYHNLGSVTGAGVAEITNQMEYDDEVAFLAAQKLYDLARESDDADAPAVVPDGLLHPPARPLCGAPANTGTSTRTARRSIPKSASSPTTSRTRIRSGSTRPATTPVSTSRREQIRRSRRGYFANISYLDDKVGELLVGARAHAHARRHDHPVLLRPWRHARRARPVVQDVLLRGLGARAADDRRQGHRRRA